VTVYQILNGRQSGDIKMFVCVSFYVPSLLLAYSAKALRAESEAQSGSGCVLSDLALFFLKIF
jgi:hypothetical protein